MTFDEFARQVQIACQAGASGFLGGRAIWEEAMHLSEASTRRAWLATVAAERMRHLHEIAGAYGRPWWRKWVSAVDELAVVGSNWYSHY